MKDVSRPDLIRAILFSDFENPQFSQITSLGSGALSTLSNYPSKYIPEVLHPNTSFNLFISLSKVVD